MIKFLTQVQTSTYDKEKTFTRTTGNFWVRYPNNQVVTDKRICHLKR